jgi:hypothetical protein
MFLCINGMFVKKREARQRALRRLHARVNINGYGGVGMKKVEWWCIQRQKKHSLSVSSLAL